MERLQKVIARSGVSSRRRAESLIEEGKVKVNGTVVTTMGAKVSANDQVEVNGVPIDKEEPVYFLLYKPTGVISSARDDKGRKKVTDFFPDVKQRIYPVGRLDYETSGLLLLTNDGDFANRLMHPRYNLDKTYIAKIEGPIDKPKLNKLQAGVRLEDGKAAATAAKRLSSDRTKNTSIVELTLHEGRNRQVRRMLEAVGCRVVKLKRESYGFLNLKGLNPGDWRELTPHEVKRLHASSVT